MEIRTKQAGEIDKKEGISRAMIGCTLYEFIHLSKLMILCSKAYLIHCCKIHLNKNFLMAQNKY